MIIIDRDAINSLDSKGVEIDRTALLQRFEQEFVQRFGQPCRGHEDIVDLFVDILKSVCKFVVGEAEEAYSEKAGPSVSEIERLLADVDAAETTLSDIREKVEALLVS